MTTATASLVDKYLETNPETRTAIHCGLQGTFGSGDDLVDRHLVPMIAWVYEQIRELVNPAELNQAQAALYIEQLSVFARHNAQFLRRACNSVEGYLPELAHELYRNFLEEGGERGKVPAHYVLYSNALLSDLGLLVNGKLARPETQLLLQAHQLMIDSHMPSLICGGYYATEGVAIAETEILYEITNRYGELTGAGTGDQLKALNYYYQLHLDEDHDAATVEGLSVEAAHIEGIARFIRASELFHVDIPQALDGFLTILQAMAHWWTQLAERSQEMTE
jgi:hypothetical protein